MMPQFFNRISQIVFTGLFVIVMIQATPGWAIVSGMVDDFQTGVDSWSGATAIQALNEGPTGSGDHSLHINANGSSESPNGKLVGFNNSQWMGDWTAAGVTAVEIQMRNPNAIPLTIWLGLTGPGGHAAGGSGDTYVSSSSVVVPADDLWHSYSFDVTAPDWSNFDGSNIVAALQGVTELRVLHNSSSNFVGAAVDAELFLDNLRAVPESSTAVLLLTAGALWPRSRSNKANLKTA